jgi:hypothetical protein
MRFDPKQMAVVGQGGSLDVRQEDEVALKMVMLIEGECEGLGPIKAAKKFGYSKQRYFQIRSAFLEQGAQSLLSRRRGPQSNYRRTDEVVRQIIRHRFLDADASPGVISQKMRQSGLVVSTRSVERVIADYGLQKKTLHVSSLGRRRKA